MDLDRTARRLLLVHTMALAIAVCTLLVGWVGVLGRPVPAGLVVLGAAVAVTAAIRRPPSALAGTAAALVVVVTLLGRRPDGGAVVLGVLLVVAILSGSASFAVHLASRRRSSRTSWAPYGQTAFLLLLSPVCAEYLAAYDDSTGHPGQLVGNLVVFVPLYGCAALLIREVARRTRLGWVGILFLGAAFGVVQSGLVDQSLFSPDYRDIDGWEEIYRATLVGPLGISAVNAVSFVSGHAIASISAPIALVEAARPRAATRPWLRGRGLVLTALAWVGASAVVLRYHLRTESWHARPGQLVSAAAVAGGCVVAAHVLGRRPRRPRPGRAVRLPLLLAGAVLLALLRGLLPQTWAGVGLDLALLGPAALAAVTLSRRPGWSPTHAAVVAAAPLLSTAALAFTYDPLVGEISAPAKYAHNATMAAVVVAATMLAVLRRPRPDRARRCSHAVGGPDDLATRGQV